MSPTLIIDELANKLISASVSLEQRSDETGCLGVRTDLDHTTCLMELKEIGLSDRVIKTVGSGIFTTSGKFTPAES